ncbi:HAD family hydrolase [Streptomyces alkaliterrae]|uniref:HAD family hydrolase n=1 Tax=Streptomyces alkaliterrae TaxID=2213162 RepID=A0A5P0YW70_9ACTN|nr:HAD family hydrolase [Streptomyces alkaliterrae]MBB1261711.1 HAD family hydrolase [Streptomyces alkaliterrae]MQS04240.1 HAD-IA family hydrolase [Streptomyces alkaliterrae]
MIRAVVFDVGETLVDETELFGGWADWLGVPRHTFSALIGAAIARGGGFGEAFQAVRPGFDFGVEDSLRERAGVPDRIREDDLYPDARACLRALKDLGVWVGVAGNQPARAGRDLRSLRLPVDLVATSGEWGVAKPDPRFFERLVATAPCAAEEILYVGDRVDRDVLPARRAGLRTALVRRGPWGYLHNGGDGEADLKMDGLVALPAWVAEQRRSSG